MQRVRVSIDHDEQEVFVGPGTYGLSLAQLILIFAGMLLWHLTSGLPQLAGAGPVLSHILTAPVILAACAGALAKIDGQASHAWCAAKLQRVLRRSPR